MSASSEDPRPDPAASDPEYLQFLQTQSSYFMSHLALADAKAGGIIAFTVAVSGVTADKLVLDEQLWPLKALAIAALIVSCIACGSALSAIWPRVGQTQSGPINPFSWLSLAGAPQGSLRGRLFQCSNRDLGEAMASVMQELAGVVGRKYQEVQIALLALVPALILHVLFWILV